MSATETLAAVFSAMCDSYCLDRSCDDCAMYAAMGDGEDCPEAFARLIRESKGEPWEAHVYDGKWCSICTHRVPEGSDACPTCGAAIL